MFSKKQKSNVLDEDKKLLLEAMERAIAGDYSQVDASLFHDPEVASKYNEVLKATVKNYNYLVMRLNDSMTRIGDSSCVKNMIEEVNSQTSAINDMRGASQDLGDSIQNIQIAVQDIQQNTHKVLQASEESLEDMEECVSIVDDSATQVQSINDQILSFKEKAEKIHEIIDMVKKVASKSGLLALNASIEAARAGEAGRSFAVVANQIKDLSANTSASADDVEKYVVELMSGIDALTEAVGATTDKLQTGHESVHKTIEYITEMNSQLGVVGEDIDRIYEEINTQSALTQNFVAAIDSMADSYENLSQDCFDTGAHLYRISRDVDKSRSDLARKGAILTTMDWLTVFEIDHFIFTWRLYNNLIGFESLTLQQLNNPKGCKLGKWLGAQTDKNVINTPEFRAVVEAHELIHTYAVESWHAKDREDREAALANFNLAFAAYEKFTKTMGALRKVFQKLGDTEETLI